MKINRLSAYIGAGLMTASCTIKKPASEKAMEHAAKYLTGIELYVAENKANKITANDIVNCSDDIFYWDSILSVKKREEYKQLGKKHILDSIAGRYRRKNFVSIQTDTQTHQNGEQIRDSVKQQVAKYCTGEEYLQLEKNAPNSQRLTKNGTSDNHITHYFGEMAIKGAQRKGFEEGIIEQKKILTNPLINITLQY